jgi:hypothetical protein
MDIKWNSLENVKLSPVMLHPYDEKVSTTKPTRTLGSELAYFSNAIYLIQKIQRKEKYISINDVTCHDILCRILLLREKLRVNSWRFAKASLMNIFERARTQLLIAVENEDGFFSEDMINEKLSEIDESIFHLSKFRWSEAISNVGKTPAQRAKELPEKNGSAKQKAVNMEFLFQIEQYIKGSGSVWQHRAVDMCLAILFTGLRPCEWEHASIEDDGTKFQLIVRNLNKQTGGEHSVARQMVITNAVAIDAVRQQILSVRRWKEDVNFINVKIDFNKTFVMQCSNAFRRAQVQLFGENKGVTPFSFRYQCAVNLKDILSEVKISQFLGVKNKSQVSIKVGAVPITPRSRKIAAVLAIMPNNYANKFINPMIDIAVLD